MIGQEGRSHAEFIYPVGITIDAAENLYVCEYGSNDRVQKFTRDGEFIAAFGSFGTGADQLQRPSGMAWKDGILYIADAINNRVSMFTDNGKFLGHLGTDLALHLPYDVTVGPDENLYIVEYGAGRVTVVDRDGMVKGRFGRTGNKSGQFATPWGISGNSTCIRVADTGNRRIVELVP